MTAITNINHLEPLCSPRAGDPAHHLCWYEAPDGKCYLAPKRGMDVTHVFNSSTELFKYLGSTYEY